MQAKYVEAQTSYHWCGAEARRGKCQLKCRPRQLTVTQNYKGRNESCLCLRQVGLPYDRWRHHLSPPAQFKHGTGGKGNILQPPAPVVPAANTHKTFGPTDLTSTYSVYTRRVFGGVGHRTQAFRSEV
ncbi:uncharacterized protein TNCV_1008161 [Trichonephila clavipes]|nr:uncharacterized protein TNCV_1008161 [Trichonephila clavipes]